MKFKLNHIVNYVGETEQYAIIGIDYDIYSNVLLKITPYPYDEIITYYFVYVNEIEIDKIHYRKLTIKKLLK